MTRINSAIPVECLTDEHLLAEHREIKRLPHAYHNGKVSGALNRVPSQFCLGTGHVTFFLDKGGFTLERYKQIYWECISRGFSIENYEVNWQPIPKLYMKEYTPSRLEKELLIERISERIKASNKEYFYYGRSPITKDTAINLLYK